MRIPNADVPSVVFDLTQAEEARDGVLSALLSTSNRFETWWQGILLAGLTKDPWNRSPGWDCEHWSDPADVAVECEWEVADRRLKYTRSTGRSRKRLDLVVRRTTSGSKLHLIELKWLDGNWTVSNRTQIPGIRKDVQALTAMKNWSVTASAWSIVLAYGFTDRVALDAKIGMVTDHVKKPWVKELELGDHDGRAWIVGLRAA